MIGQMNRVQDKKFLRQQGEEGENLKVDMRS